MLNKKEVVSWMIPISSALENSNFSLQTLEEKLKPQGFVIGGNWDYDHGSFDYKMTNEDGYQFLRVPFKAIEGMLDSPGVVVKLGKPFVLTHLYQSGIEEESDNGALQGAINQFQSPADPDAAVPGKYIRQAERLVTELESLLLEER